MRAVAFGFLLGAVTVGCVAEGSVEITFLLPEAEDLSPVGTNVTLAKVALVTNVPGESPQRFEVPIADGGEGLDIGRIPISDGVRLAVELRAPSQRLIGYGRTADPIDVVGDSVTEVEIALRRPFAYVTGGTSIATYDAALEPEFPYRSSISVSPPPIDLAPTRGGDELVSVAANELRLVSTSSHTPMAFAPVPLSQAPTAVALSPGDEYAVVAHGGASGGISIVRLGDVRGETASASFVPLGNATGVAVARGAAADDAPLVYVLLDGLFPSADCAGAPASRIVAVSLDNPSETVLTVEPGMPVSDFAVHATADAMALAAPCEPSWNLKVLEPRAAPGTVHDLQEIRRATRVAIVEDRVWSVGVQPSSGNTGARLLVGTVGFDRSGATVLELPEAEERALSNDFTRTGQFAELSMSADQLFPLDLAVLPGEDHIAVLARGYYHGEEVIGDVVGFPTVIIPEMELTAFEYQLVDIASATPVQRVRTLCDLDWASGAYLDDFDCTTVPGQDVVSGEGFVPTQLSVLNGNR